MNTLPADGFAIDPDYNPMTWPIDRNRNLVASCTWGTTFGEVFAYNAMDRVFASKGSGQPDVP